MGRPPHPSSLANKTLTLMQSSLYRFAIRGKLYRWLLRETAFFHPSPDNLHNVFLLLVYGERESSFSWAKHGNGKNHFYSHSMGQCSVVWPPLTAKVAGICSLVCAQEENKTCLGEYLAVTAMVSHRLQDMPSLAALYAGLLHSCQSSLIAPTLDLVCSISQHREHP